MGKVAKKFMVGNYEEASFKHIGLDIKTTSQGITLDQIDYIKDRLQPASLRGGENSGPLNKQESMLLQKLTGQINWTASQMRPDVSYAMVELSMKFKQGQLEDLKKTNKAIARLIASPTMLLFPKMTGKLKLVIYSDAAYANLQDQILSIPIYSFVDYNNLQQAINTTTLVLDRWLRVNIAFIQQSMLKHKVNVKWIGAPKMIADCLTKRTAKSDTLMNLVTTGRLPKEVQKKVV